jgi:hypothetical protein
MTAKCPKCERLVSSFDIEGFVAKSGSNDWNCIAFTCPFCRFAISAQVDPIAIRGDVISTLTSRVESKVDDSARQLKREINSLSGEFERLLRRRP